MFFKLFFVFVECSGNMEIFLLSSEGSDLKTKQNKTVLCFFSWRNCFVVFIAWVSLHNNEKKEYVYMSNDTLGIEVNIQIICFQKWYKYPRARYFIDFVDG